MRILKLHVEQKRLSTVEAELCIWVELDEEAAGAQLRGQLSGPRCPHAETIQLAYPLKAFPHMETSPTKLMGRVIIPEPNLWTADMPFTYSGEIAIWQQDAKIDERSIQVSFKMS